MPNRLIKETSPYLIQHAENPVDWYPWSEAALAKSRDEDRPIFLSIGYSACHWCHVMEHESFEDEEIAEFLNDHFVSIKVDREERPDLDQIYMQAVMALRGGQGGWPLSVFLTPDHHVFYGGTYWPPRARAHMPGFLDVLRRVLEAFRDQRDAIDQQSLQVTDWLQRVETPTVSTITPKLVADAVSRMKDDFDFDWGGFGTEPKFPHASSLLALLDTLAMPAEQSMPEAVRHAAQEMVRMNLQAMRRGGIYDQIGGGFARYSVDREWLVPHFEKMLYDNALLAQCYLEAYAAFGRSDDAQVARETLLFMMREVRDPLGGFHSSLDADSEGEEGKFYVWSRSEFRELLGDEIGKRLGDYWGVTEYGNFEGNNILFLTETAEAFSRNVGISVDAFQSQLQEARARLLTAREQRVRPHKDDKIIASWNALAVSAMAAGYRILRDPEFLSAAEDAMAFNLQHLTNPQGRMLRCYRNGVAKPLAFLDDYSYTLVALIDLYEACFDEAHIEEAERLAQDLLQHFGDEAGATLFFVGRDQEPLIARMKDQHDSSVPSGNSMAAEGLMRLGRLAGQADLVDRAAAMLQEMQPLMSKAPLAASQALATSVRWLAPSVELVAMVRDDRDEQAMCERLRTVWLPLATMVVRNESKRTRWRAQLDHLFAGRQTEQGEPVLYVCQDYQCRQPAVGWQDIDRALASLKASP